MIAGGWLYWREVSDIEHRHRGTGDQVTNWLLRPGALFPAPSMDAAASYCALYSRLSDFLARIAVTDYLATGLLILLNY
jgi:hypothetical protein